MSTSVGNNQNPWAPYATYKDCSQAICSIYCPQGCYTIFPPPPPFNLEDEDDDSGTDFSPLIIAVIGILASAFILVTYYTIISKYCKRRSDETGLEFSENRDQMSANDQAWQLGNNVGLDEALIKSITVCKYKKGDGLVEGTDCSVCLSEFQEHESLRLLPKCNHAFHLPCIDTWLKSHSSCPLCRATIISFPAAQASAPGEVSESDANVSAHQYQHTNDAAVLVIHDIEDGVNNEAVVSIVVNDEAPKTPNVQDDSIIEVGVDALPIRRSVSLNSSSCQGPFLVADILSTNEQEDDDEEIQLESTENINSSRSKVMNLVRNSSLGLKRSISTGRFKFTRYGSKDGNSVIIPN